MAVANVEILWNARRRQKASASAPQCTSNKTKRKKREPCYKAPLLMHSHSCCLQRADCLRDPPSHVSACFLFTERHGTFHHTGKICCVSIKWLQQKKGTGFGKLRCNVQFTPDACAVHLCSGPAVELTGFHSSQRACSHQMRVGHVSSCGDPEPSGENTQNFSTEQVVRDGRSGAETK